MRRLTIAEPDSPAWRRWKASGAKKKAKHIVEAAAGDKVSVTDYYKRQKEAYRDPDGLFKGKCAFCEQSITGNQHGDIEHFRPKAAVQDENWQPVTRPVNGADEEHPGYYWLAYDWQNLLLACIKCNQVADGREWGKGNRFPVVGAHAWSHDDPSDEQPLLLNPAVDDPSAHMTLDGPTGILTHLTERGRVTIDILGLNKRDLYRRRANVYQDVSDKIDLWAARRGVLGHENMFEKLQAHKSDEKQEFYSVVRQAYREIIGALAVGYQAMAEEA